VKSKTRNRSDQAAKPMQDKSGSAPQRFLGLPKWACILLIIGIVAGVSFAAFELDLPDRIPPELVGAWRVVGGPMSGTTMEFHRNGDMIGRVTVDGKEGVIEGTAEVTDKTLRTTTINPITKRADTGTQTIVTWSESELVTEDARGVRITLKRVR
jgi:uncharacterized protein (TIGR03066 family)